MVLNAIVLSGVFAVCYSKWREQQRTGNKRIIARQKQIADRIRLRKNAGGKALQNQEVKSAQLKQAAAQENLRSPKELISLSVSMLLSGPGYLIYPPAAYLALPFLIYGARRNYYKAWHVLKKGRVDIETFSAITLTGTIITQHFFLGSLLILIKVIGERLTSRVIKDSQYQLLDVFQDMPKTVWVQKDGYEISIPFSEVKKGDTVVVNAGEVIPADGPIIWGVGGIDEHRLTGEAIPVEKKTGDPVFAMTLVLSGVIHIRVEKAGSESSAMEIAEILNQTADYKSFTLLRAEDFSRQLVKPTLATSAIAWPLLGFGPAVAVFFLHPKDRFLVSAPISLLRCMKQASEGGILIKDGRSLELLQKVDTIVFDKTGTLTDEQPHVGKITCFASCDEDEVLRLAAIAEYKQTHPLAQAILKTAEQRGLLCDVPEHTEYRLGYGVKVVAEGQTIRVGSLRFMEQEQVIVPDCAQSLQESARLQGCGLILVSLENQLIGAVELLPTIRAEAKQVIRQLKELKTIKKMYIISGDHETPTRHLAQELGIDDYFAQTLPHQKAELIENLQQQGAFVCFIGDGVNDAIAMKRAQVSVSLSGASQLATDTAQVVLLNKGIQHLPKLFELSQKFHRHMSQQLVIIFGGSLIGVSAIFLGGWGMGYVMALNISSLTLALAHSLFDRLKINEQKSATDALRLSSPKANRIKRGFLSSREAR